MTYVVNEQNSISFNEPYMTTELCHLHVIPIGYYIIYESGIAVTFNRRWPITTPTSRMIEPYTTISNLEHWPGDPTMYTYYQIFTP